MHMQLHTLPNGGLAHSAVNVSRMTAPRYPSGRCGALLDQQRSMGPRSPPMRCDTVSCFRRQTASAWSRAVSGRTIHRIVPGVQLRDEPLNEVEAFVADLEARLRAEYFGCGRQKLSVTLSAQSPQVGEFVEPDIPDRRGSTPDMTRYRSRAMGSRVAVRCIVVARG
jgi:hypothetical protein